MSNSTGHGQMVALREKIRHTAVTLRLFAQCMESFTEDCMSGTHISEAHRADMAQVLRMIRACSPLSEEEEEENIDSAHQREAVVRSRSRSRSAHRQETGNSEDSEAHGRNHQGNQRERSGARDHSSAAPLHSKELDHSRGMIACPVCMSSVADISLSNNKLASTLCGHVFCSECLQQLLTSTRQCPTCRKRIFKKDIREIYL